MQKNPFIKLNLFAWKSSGEFRARDNILQHNKRNVWICTVNIILNGENLNAMQLKSGMRQRCPQSLLFLNIVLETLVGMVWQEIEIKSQTVFLDDTIWTILEIKNSSRNILTIINKQQWDSIHDQLIQNKRFFLHTSNK